MKPLLQKFIAGAFAILLAISFSACQEDAVSPATPDAGKEMGVYFD